MTTTKKPDGVSTTKKADTKMTTKKPDTKVTKPVKADKKDDPMVQPRKPAKKPAKTPARKLGGKKKKVKVCKVVPPPKPPCNTTQYGCCPDGSSPAQGPFAAGERMFNILSNSGRIN